MWRSLRGKEPRKARPATTSWPSAGKDLGPRASSPWGPAPVRAQKQSFPTVNPKRLSAKDPAKPALDS